MKKKQKKNLEKVEEWLIARLAPNAYVTMCWIYLFVWKVSFFSLENIRLLLVSRFSDMFNLSFIFFYSSHFDLGSALNSNEYRNL